MKESAANELTTAQIMKLEKNIRLLEDNLRKLNEESISYWINGDYERLRSCRMKEEQLRACIEDSQRKLNELQDITGTRETMQPKEEDPEGSAGSDSSDIQKQ